MVLLFYIFLNLWAAVPTIESVSLADVKIHILYKYCVSYCVFFVLLAKQYILYNAWDFYGNCFWCIHHQECREGNKTHYDTSIAWTASVGVCWFFGSMDLQCNRVFI